MGCGKSSSKREVYSNKILPQETIKALNRKFSFTSKTIRKRRTTPPNKPKQTKKNKVIRRKELIKIRAEINEKD